MGPSRGAGQVLDFETVSLLGFPAEDILGRFLTADPAAVLDGPDRERGKCGGEHCWVLAPGDQTGVPAEGKGNRLLDAVGPGLLATEPTKTDLGVHLDAGHDNEKSVLQGG